MIQIPERCIHAQHVVTPRDVATNPFSERLSVYTYVTRTNQ